jgi:hypothetical protein
MGKKARPKSILNVLAGPYKHAYWRGRVSKVDLLIKIRRFVNKEKYSFSMKSSRCELISTRRSIVLSLPFLLGFSAVACLKFGSTWFGRIPFGWKSILPTRHFAARHKGDRHLADRRLANNSLIGKMTFDRCNSDPSHLVDKSLNRLNMSAKCFLTRRHEKL